MTEDPPLIDTSIPHSARIWNYWLGGRDHYAVDRVAGERYRSTYPAVSDLARASRRFLARTVTYLAREAGIRQFVDIGAGLPTADNTHEVAQRAAPDSRVVYVDNDPLVVAHARALLTGRSEGATDCLLADVHDPEAILDASRRTLDLTRPVGVVLSGVLGHVRGYGEARSLVRRLLRPLPAGSHLTLNDGTRTLSRELGAAQEDYNGTGATPYHLRTPYQIAGFFDGLRLVEPGVVSCPRWRPAPGEPEPCPELDAFGGVGKKF